MSDIMRTGAEVAVRGVGTKEHGVGVKERGVGVGEHDCSGPAASPQLGAV